MINLRYHIVSITAVFLALGIGLTLGSSFLDRVTVDTLKDRLNSVQGRVDATDRENGLLKSEVGSLESRDRLFSAALPDRLLAGYLTDVPVLVIATKGTSDELVAATVGALATAGAQVAGTWWLTDSWALDSESQVRDLESALAVTTTDPDRLRRIAAIQLSDLLTAASQPPAAPTDPAIPAPAPAPPVEPPLLAALKNGGFVDYTAAPGGSAPVLLPAASVRYVVVSNAVPGSGPHRLAVGLLEQMVTDAIAPVVAAQGKVELSGSSETRTSEDERRTTFVGPLRNGELSRDRLSTIDDLDTAAGLAALVLAVEDLGIPVVGHYGSSSSSSRLLPPARVG